MTSSQRCPPQPDHLESGPQQLAPRDANPGDDVSGRQRVAFTPFVRFSAALEHKQATRQRIDDPHPPHAGRALLALLPQQPGQGVVLAANFGELSGDRFQESFRRQAHRERGGRDERGIGRNDAVRVSSQYDANFSDRLAIPGRLARIVELTDDGPLLFPVKVSGCRHDDETPVVEFVSCGPAWQLVGKSGTIRCGQQPRRRLGRIWAEDGCHAYDSSRRIVLKLHDFKIADFRTRFKTDYSDGEP